MDQRVQDYVDDIEHIKGIKKKQKRKPKKIDVIQFDEQVDLQIDAEKNNQQIGQGEAQPPHAFRKVEQSLDDNQGKFQNSNMNLMQEKIPKKIKGHSKTKKTKKNIIFKMDEDEQGNNNQNSKELGDDIVKHSQQILYTEDMLKSNVSMRKLNQKEGDIENENKEQFIEVFGKKFRRIWLIVFGIILLCIVSLIVGLAVYLSKKSQQNSEQNKKDPNRGPILILERNWKKYQVHQMSNYVTLQTSNQSSRINYTTIYVVTNIVNQKINFSGVMVKTSEQKFRQNGTIDITYYQDPSTYSTILQNAGSIGLDNGVDFSQLEQLENMNSSSMNWTGTPNINGTEEFEINAYIPVFKFVLNINGQIESISFPQLFKRQSLGLLLNFIKMFSPLLDASLYHENTSSQRSRNRLLTQNNTNSTSQEIRVYSVSNDNGSIGLENSASTSTRSDGYNSDEVSNSTSSFDQQGNLQNSGISSISSFQSNQIPPNTTGATYNFNLSFQCEQTASLEVNYKYEALEQSVFIFNKFMEFYESRNKTLYFSLEEFKYYIQNGTVDGDFNTSNETRLLFSSLGSLKKYLDYNKDVDIVNTDFLGFKIFAGAYSKLLFHIDEKSQLMKVPKILFDSGLNIQLGNWKKTLSFYQYSKQLPQATLLLTKSIAQYEFAIRAVKFVSNIERIITIFNNGNLYAGSINTQLFNILNKFLAIEAQANSTLNIETLFSYIKTIQQKALTSQSQLITRIESNNNRLISQLDLFMESNFNGNIQQIQGLIGNLSNKYSSQISLQILSYKKYFNLTMFNLNKTVPASLFDQLNQFYSKLSTFLSFYEHISTNGLNFQQKFKNETQYIDAQFQNMTKQIIDSIFESAVLTNLTTQLNNTEQILKHYQQQFLNGPGLQLMKNKLLASIAEVLDPNFLDNYTNLNLQYSNLRQQLINQSQNLTNLLQTCPNFLVFEKDPKCLTLTVPTSESLLKIWSQNFTDLLIQIQNEINNFNFTDTTTKISQNIFMEQLYPVKMTYYSKLDCLQSMNSFMTYRQLFTVNQREIDNFQTYWMNTLDNTINVNSSCVGLTAYADLLSNFTANLAEMNSVGQIYDQKYTQISNNWFELLKMIQQATSKQALINNTKTELLETITTLKNQYPTYLKPFSSYNFTAITRQIQNVLPILCPFSQTLFYTYQIPDNLKQYSTFVDLWRDQLEQFIFPTLQLTYLAQYQTTQNQTRLYEYLSQSTRLNILNTDTIIPNAYPDYLSSKPVNNRELIEGQLYISELMPFLNTIRNINNTLYTHMVNHTTEANLINSWYSITNQFQTNYIEVTKLLRMLYNQVKKLQNLVKGESLQLTLVKEIYKNASIQWNYTTDYILARENELEDLRAFYYTNLSQYYNIEITNKNNLTSKTEFINYIKQIYNYSKIKTNEINTILDTTSTNLTTKIDQISTIINNMTNQTEKLKLIPYKNALMDILSNVSVRIYEDMYVGIVIDGYCQSVVSCQDNIFHGILDNFTKLNYVRQKFVEKVIPLSPRNMTQQILRLNEIDDIVNRIRTKKAVFLTEVLKATHNLLYIGQNITDIFGKAQIFLSEIKEQNGILQTFYQLSSFSIKQSLQKFRNQAYYSLSSTVDIDMVDQTSRIFNMMQTLYKYAMETLDQLMNSPKNLQVLQLMTLLKNYNLVYNFTDQNFGYYSKNLQRQISEFKNISMMFTSINSSSINGFNLTPTLKNIGKITQDYYQLNDTVDRELSYNIYTEYNRLLTNMTTNYVFVNQTLGQINNQCSNVIPKQYTSTTNFTIMGLKNNQLKNVSEAIHIIQSTKFCEIFNDLIIFTKSVNTFLGNKSKFMSKYQSEIKRLEKFRNEVQTNIMNVFTFEKYFTNLKDNVKNQYINVEKNITGNFLRIQGKLTANMCNSIMNSSAYDLLKNYTSQLLIDLNQFWDNVSSQQIIQIRQYLASISHFSSAVLSDLQKYGKIMINGIPLKQFIQKSDALIQNSLLKIKNKLFVLKMLKFVNLFTDLAGLDGIKQNLENSIKNQLQIIKNNYQILYDALIKSTLPINFPSINTLLSQISPMLSNLTSLIANFNTGICQQMVDIINTIINDADFGVFQQLKQGIIQIGKYANLPNPIELYDIMNKNIYDITVPIFYMQKYITTYVGVFIIRLDINYRLDIKFFARLYKYRSIDLGIDVINRLQIFAYFGYGVPNVLELGIFVKGDLVSATVSPLFQLSNVIPLALVKPLVKLPPIESQNKIKFIFATDFELRAIVLKAGAYIKHLWVEIYWKGLQICIWWWCFTIPIPMIRIVLLTHQFGGYINGPTWRVRLFSLTIFQINP